MHHPFMIGHKIYLRGLEEEDLQGEYFQWFNDVEVCKYNSHALFPNTKHSMHEYFKESQTSRSLVVFAVISKDSDKHIGNVSLQNIDWISRSAEFAIIIGDKAWWGKNIGYEIGQLVLSYAFDRLNLRRVYCGTHELNSSMQKLAIKLGMQLEGRRIKAGFKNGEYYDILEYGVNK